MPLCVIYVWYAGMRVPSPHQPYETNIGKLNGMRVQVQSAHGTAGRGHQAKDAVAAVAVAAAAVTAGAKAAAAVVAAGAKVAGRGKAAGGGVRAGEDATEHMVEDMAATSTTGRVRRRSVWLRDTVE